MLNRRNFLMQLGLLGAGLTMAPQLIAAKVPQKAGFQLYNLRAILASDVPGNLAKVAAAGYSVVETFGYSKENGFWGLKPEKLKSLLQENGLTSISGHYNFNKLFIDGDLSEVDNVLQAAKILGQQYIVIPWLAKGFIKDSATMDKTIAYIAKAAAHVKKAGLKLAYHNHDFEFIPVDGKVFYEQLLEKIDPKLLDFELDVYWVVRVGQDPVKWFEKYPGRFKLLHIKDMDKENPQLNTEIGNGSIDYKRIIAHAAVGGVKQLIMEQENFKIDPFESIKRSAAYMNANLIK